MNIFRVFHGVLLKQYYNIMAVVDMNAWTALFRFPGRFIRISRRFPGRFRRSIEVLNVKAHWVWQGTLQLVAHPVNLLDVGKYHLGVNPLVLHHGLHVVGGQEVGDAGITPKIVYI